MGPVPPRPRRAVALTHCIIWKSHGSLCPHLSLMALGEGGMSGAWRASLFPGAVQEEAASHAAWAGQAPGPVWMKALAWPDSGPTVTKAQVVNRDPSPDTGQLPHTQRPSLGLQMGEACARCSRCLGRAGWQPLPQAAPEFPNCPSPSHRGRQPGQERPCQGAPALATTLEGPVLTPPIVVFFLSLFLFYCTGTLTLAQRVRPLFPRLLLGL